MICEDCGGEMRKYKDYVPAVWKCFRCGIEVEEDAEIVDELDTSSDNENPIDENYEGEREEK